MDKTSSGEAQIPLQQCSLLGSNLEGPNVQRLPAETDSNQD